MVNVGYVEWHANEYVAHSGKIIQATSPVADENRWGRRDVFVKNVACDDNEVTASEHAIKADPPCRFTMLMMISQRRHRPPGV